MPYEVEVTATFATLDEADRAVADMEEAVAKNNGELNQSTINPEED